MRYKEYEEYKDSGVEWLGKVPQHWIKSKISRVFDIISSGGTPKSSNELYYENGEINWLLTGDLNDGYIEDTSKKITKLAVKENSTLREYKKNSLVMAMYGATIGKLGITNIETTTNQACCVMSEPKDCDIKYMFYWFLGNRREIINLSQGGGQPNISQGIVKSLSFYKPTFQEQEKIVEFLDKKTSEIDKLIEEKEKLIELLKEKREAIITEAVTKGLDKNVKMKDSGIEWIGEIPACWDMINLGYKTKMIVPMRDKPKNFEGDIPWIRIEDFEGKYICDTKSDQYVSKEIADEMNLKIYPINTVLCSCSCRMGITAIVKREMCSNQTFIGIVPNSDMDSEFLYYLMKSNSKRLQYLSSGALQEYLSRQSFEHLKIQVPSLKEQKYIAKYIDSKVNLIDELIEDLNREIEIINDYKKSLISEVVTGKIDVRNEL